MDILEGLNNAQKSAVITTGGPVLILAGAGSGKTKTLTHRIAYLLTHERVWPNEILAVTFTNKAAKEMRERLATLTAQANTRSFMPWMGTFHSMCVRILRQDGNAIGIATNFVIYDEDDRQGLVKQAMKQLSVSVDQVKPRAVSAAISGAKNDLVGPEEYMRAASYHTQRAIGEVYARYEQMREAAGALDFDDLLLKTVQLFHDNADVRTRYQQQFKHIMIDEYQDTNAAQYAIVKALVNTDRNVCVVGDDWQSIYGWRGADFRNILRFEKDFPGAMVVKLEQNYRSTASILEAAHNVITKNIERTDKALWTDIGKGAPVMIHAAYDEGDEAHYIADRMSAQVALGARQYGDFAVLYRTNAQSFAIERALMQYHIPYQVVGGVRFYDRQEIKDVIAYLRLLYQPNDRMSFSRIVNVPTRGIGDTSLEKFLAWQSMSGFDIITALRNADQTDTLTPRAKKALMHLGETLVHLQGDSLAGTNPHDIIDRLLERVGYHEYILDGTPRAEERVENIAVLLNDSQTFATLADFLEEVALMSSIDQATDQQAVTLMTIHAAKGLEFPVVFMAGMEDGLFPSSRALEEGPHQLEEERRLCYVGMTRAREELHMIYAQSRAQFGNRSYGMPSRFLEDMGYGALATQQVAAAPPRYNDFDELVMEFDINDQVHSPQFGVGTIIDIDGMAVTVMFESGATKKLNVEYARLQKT